MNIGIYQSAASLSALEQWQDAVAQNITSSQVPGYRKRVVDFGEQASGSWTVATGTSSESTVTPIFPTATNGINYQGGDTEHTGRPLDVAIQGDGFFEIQTPDGKAYSRNGSFSIASNHTLVTGSGDPVMSSSGGRITLLPNGADITINPDGTIVQGDAAVGKLGVKAFTNQQDLRPVENGYFVSASGEAPKAVSADLLQGYREASNVNPMREMVDLVMISRSYEANQKVITSADQQGQKALDALG